MKNNKPIIRGLTLIRPWGFAVAYLNKDIENRTWKPHLPIGSYIAIHNGKKWDAQGAKFVAEKNAMGLIDSPTPETDLPGQIIAVSKYMGTVDSSDSPWFFGPFGWILKDTKIIAPVKCSGQQGLWVLADDIYPQVQENYRQELHWIKNET